MPLASRPAAGVGDIDLDSICRQLRPIDKEQLDLSAVLHIIRIWGASYEVRIPSDELPHSLLDVLTDERLGQLAFGSSPMIITDFGVRYPGVEPFGRIRNAHSAGESHRDQFLSTMAELGVPLSQVISMNAGGHVVREVLSDSLAQFHLEQEELAWTAYAYALYLPPQSRWQNRYAEDFSFDDVAEELLARPLGKASCCGTHIVFALTAIFHADSAFPILKPSVRQRIEERLREWLEIIVVTQLPDGGWLAAWWQPSVVPNQSTARLAAVPAHGDLLATSHLMEWLYMFPTLLKCRHARPTRLPGICFSGLGLLRMRKCVRSFAPTHTQVTF